MTVSPAISSISRPETAGIAYLTVAEFEQAPTGIPTDNLVPGASLQDNNALLQTMILRGSSWLDNQCHQVLGATTDTEIAKARVRSDGSMRIFTRCFPIREVTSVAVGRQPSGFTQLTSLSNCAVFTRSFMLTGQPWAYWVPYGLTAAPYCWVQYSYVNGYPVTTLSDACEADATSLDLVSALGVLPGMTLSISDIPNSETVVVDSVADNSVTLVSGTQAAHGEGIYVSSLPDAIKQAAVLATSGLIRLRGAGAVVMDSINGRPEQQAPSEPGGLADLAEAHKILADGRFIVRVPVSGMS